MIVAVASQWLIPLLSPRNYRLRSSLYITFRTKFDLALRMRILLVSSSHGRGMASRMRALGPEYGTSIEVYECWHSGWTISEIRDKVEREISSIKTYSPRVCIAHLSHNDLARHHIKNVTPIWPKETISKLWDLALYLQYSLRDSVVIMSVPWPRVSSKYNSEAFVAEYNGTANQMLGHMRTKARRTIERNGFELRVLSTPELWLSSSQLLGAREYFEVKDGLHLNATGKVIIARKWVEAALNPSGIILPPVPGEKKVKRKANRKRGGKKHKKQ